MNNTYFLEQTFNKANFQQLPLNKGEYERCVFNNCIFSDCNLSEVKFSDCVFHDCNLSMANITKVSFWNTQFKDCKMLGLKFDSCNEFALSFTFENCILNFSTFYKTKIKKTLFKNCQLQEVDFTETDLSNVKFENCDLLRAFFMSSNLESANFRTAYNYSIDPESNRMKKAKFSILGLSGLLEKHKLDIE